MKNGALKPFHTWFLIPLRLPPEAVRNSGTFVRRCRHCGVTTDAWRLGVVRGGFSVKNGQHGDFSPFTDINIDELYEYI